jgi:hypothetical protein
MDKGEKKANDSHLITLHRSFTCLIILYNADRNMIQNDFVFQFHSYSKCSYEKLYSPIGDTPDKSVS